MTDLKTTLNQRAKRRNGKSPLVVVFLPILVWCVAIVAAIWIYRGLGTRGSVTGYAEDRPVTLAHLETGVVRDVRVQLHQAVYRGQVVLAMDDTDERLVLAAMEKDIDRLKSNIEAERVKFITDNARASSDVKDLERRFLAEREAAHIAYLEQMRSDAEDRITLRGREIEYDIVKSLHDQSDATFREMNLIQTTVDSLKKRLEENVPLLEKLKQTYEDTDKRWFAYKDHGDVSLPYDTALTPIRLAAEVRERELQELVYRIDEHVLRAPLDGQVTALYAKSGDHVLAGAPLVAISPVQTQRLVAYLPESETFAVQVGDRVTVQPIASASGRAKSYPATVESLSATVAEAPPRFRNVPTYPVWGREMVVRINTDSYVMPGEGVKITFGW